MPREKKEPYQKLNNPIPLDMGIFHRRFVTCLVIKLRAQFHMFDLFEDIRAAFLPFFFSLCTMNENGRFAYRYI